MAQKRMFDVDIVCSDDYIDLPHSTQSLYVQFSMHADDRGIVASPKKIMRMVRCSDKDVQLLVDNKFILPLNDKICVIKHWNMNNFIRKDRFKESKYFELLKNIVIKTNKAYSLDENKGMKLLENKVVNQPTSNRQPSKEENSIDKVSIDKNSIEPDVVDIIDFWNTLEIIECKKTTDKIVNLITLAIKEHSKDEVMTFIHRYNTAIKDKSYFWSYPWNIQTFFNYPKTKQEFTNMKDFYDDGMKWNDYLTKSNKGGGATIVKVDTSKIDF